MLTYKKYEGPSPAIIREYKNGSLVALYRGYLDRTGWVWTLYPNRRILTWSDVPFVRKTVSVRKVIIESDPQGADKPAAQKDEPEKKSRLSLKERQIKLI